MDLDLPLSLDDFIPPHLQKKQNRGASQTYNAHTDSPGEADLVYKATLVLTDDSRDNPIPRKEKRWIRYEGIGPTDELGMPFASRSSVDKPREWYKNMYRVLHQMSDSEDSDGDGNQSKPEDHHKDDFTLLNQSKFMTDQNNGQLEDRSKRTSQEPSHLHMTVMSNVRESPIKASSTLKIERSSDSSKSHASTLPRSAPQQTSQKSPHYSSNVSHFINDADAVPSSQNYNTQLSHRQSSTGNKQQTSVPALRYFYPDRSPYSSQSNKEAGSIQSLNQKPKNSSSRPTSDTRILSPTSKEPSKLTSKVLEQLETDLRNFTEELDRDLEARKQHPEATLERCEEVISRSYSHPAGGSPEPKVNKSRRQCVESQQDRSPVAKAVVKFDFVAESEKEISLQRGTTVNILKRVDGHWLLGEQDGRRGLFPESYVRVLIPGQEELSDTPQLSGVALYDFKADSDKELPLRKGQRVLINRRVGSDWFEGRTEGSSRRGLFPASYVQVTDGLVQARKVDTIIKPAKDTNSVEQVSSTLVLKERPCTVKAPESNRLHELQGTPYRVLFNHSPKNKDELQLNTGDMVTVTQQCDDGWYVGVCWRTQKFGTFPGNFVVPCESP
ncbi:vinexin isoform X2 [Eleutherodactylus coqui]|uniref:vinexin isoform X2 n=1 Tax=Eleutherodactylus coqui TaxID=57060 RepID=UPI00346223CB